MKRILFILLLSVISRCLIAQDDVTSGVFNLNLGYGYADINTASVFFPEIENDITPHHFILGSEIMSGKDKYLFGLSFNVSFSAKIDVDSLQVNQFSNDYLVLFGYQMIKKPKYKIYPIVGLGFGLQTLNAVNTNTVSATQITDSHFQEINLIQYSVVGSAAINTIFFSGNDKYEKEKPVGLDGDFN
ncbi:MAG: hypothetical protein IPI65_15825 [Bacteroidetes bacterium]|nr:hypothetical protein [Bacteroidota bacterium]